MTSVALRPRNAKYSKSRNSAATARRRATSAAMARRAERAALRARRRLETRHFVMGRGISGESDDILIYPAASRRQARDYARRLNREYKAILHTAEKTISVVEAYREAMFA